MRCHAHTYAREPVQPPPHHGTDGLGFAHCWDGHIRGFCPEGGARVDTSSREEIGHACTHFECNLHLVLIYSLHQLSPGVKVCAFLETGVPLLNGLVDIRHVGRADTRGALRAA